MGPQTARTPSGSKLVGRQPRGEACPGPTASHAPRAEGALLRPTIRVESGEVADRLGLGQNLGVPSVLRRPA